MIIPALNERVSKQLYGGTYRTVDPAETVARVQRLAPIMGITRIANVTGLDYIGVPVVMCCRPNSRAIAVSQGKGLTLDSAKASALMESVESYHAESITAPLKYASYDELRFTHTVADPDELPKIRNGKYHPAYRLLWIEGYDLMQQESVWLPYELAHTDFTMPLPPGSKCFLASSNGLASGNHLLEALIHALTEVIERDAITLWTYTTPENQAATRVDLSTVDDPGCRQVLDQYEAAQIDVAVWEMTTDVGLPVYKCMIVERTRTLRQQSSAGGYGCHTARHTALLRALTEAAQSRLTMISGSRDDIARADFDNNRSQFAVSETRETIQGANTPRRFQDAPTFDTETFNDDLSVILGKLQAVGIKRVIALDLTKPEFNIPVIRAVVPGLEMYHVADGYQPGKRLKQQQARQAAETNHNK